MAGKNAGSLKNTRNKVSGGGDGRKVTAKSKKTVPAIWTLKKNSPTPRVSLKKVTRKMASPKRATGKAQTRAGSKQGGEEKIVQKQAGKMTTRQPLVSKGQFQPPKQKEVVKPTESIEEPMEYSENVGDKEQEYAQDNWDGFESSASDRNASSSSEGSPGHVAPTSKDISSPERTDNKKR